MAKFVFPPKKGAKMPMEKEPMMAGMKKEMGKPKPKAKKK